MGNLPVLSGEDRATCSKTRIFENVQCQPWMCVGREPFAKVGTAVKCLKSRLSEHKHSSISLQFIPTLTLLQNIHTPPLIKKRLRHERRDKLSKNVGGIFIISGQEPPHCIFFTCNWKALSSIVLNGFRRKWEKGRNNRDMGWNIAMHGLLLWKRTCDWNAPSWIVSIMLSDRSRMSRAS